MMEVEHFIGFGVVLVVASLAAWLVWTCLCSKGEEDQDVESQLGDEDEKSVNSRTKVIGRQSQEQCSEDDLNNTKSDRDPALREVFIKPKSKTKSSCYVQSRQTGLADPFGEWTRREKLADDTATLSGIKTYRKSPVLPHRR